MCVCVRARVRAFVVCVRAFVVVCVDFFTDTDNFFI